MSRQEGSSFRIKPESRSVLSHKHRKDRIYVLSADSALASDVQERLGADVRLRGCAIRRPPETDFESTIAEINRMAPKTVSARLIILDVRKQTLPWLQSAYNKIIGYNRMDLNEHCYCILIGDGPANLFENDRGLDVFAPYLAKHRADYLPAMYFFDPFLHYTPAELPPASALDSNLTIPTCLPQRLAGEFKEDDITVGDIRKFFRAATVRYERKQAARERRSHQLVELLTKRICEQFDQPEEVVNSWITPAGYSVSGEPLRLHIYPLFFEDWAVELFLAAKEFQTPNRKQ